MKIAHSVWDPVYPWQRPLPIVSPFDSNKLHYWFALHQDFVSFSITFPPVNLIDMTETKISVNKNKHDQTAWHDKDATKQFSYYNMAKK